VLFTTRMIANTKDSRPTVLVVDDETGPREAFKLVLEDRFNVLTAESGHAALKTLNENRVDVITLDLMMPSLSGVETLKRIREVDSDVEVVVVSALPAGELVSQCTELRAFDILAKPFSRAEILSAADRAARRRNARRREDLASEL
jgi:putative two-component system response regulator